MKLRLVTKLRRFFIPALAALSLGIGISACSSDGETEQPEAGLSEEGNNNFNAEGGNNLNNLGNENFEGNASSELGNNSDLVAEGNPAGNELQNLVNEGGADAMGEPPLGNAALNDASTDPFLNNMEATDPAAAAADPYAMTDGTDPMAADAGAMDPAADPMAAPVDGYVPNETAVPPANALAGTNSNMLTETENTEVAEEFPTDAAVPTDAAPVETAPATTPVASVSGPLPESGTKMAYYIRPGDTIASIAQKIYGNKSKWRELASENNIVNPNRIYSGDVLYYTLDDASKNFADSYESAPKSSVTVQAGDTLSQIAAKVYGNESEWRTLWKENPQIHNPDVISAGMVVSFRDFSGVRTAAYTTGEEEDASEEASADDSYLGSEI